MIMIVSLLILFYLVFFFNNTPIIVLSSVYVCLGIPHHESDDDVGPSFLVDNTDEEEEGGEQGPMEEEEEGGEGGKEKDDDPWASYVPDPPLRFHVEEAMEDGGLLYKNANISVLAASTFIWSLAKTAGWRREHINELLKFMHHVLLPAGNRLPSTMYKLQRVIGEPQLWDCTFRMCPTDCLLWHERDELRLGIRQRETCVCPKCRKPLFKQQRGKTVPVQTCIYFGIASMIR